MNAPIPHCLALALLAVSITPSASAQHDETGVAEAARQQASSPPPREGERVPDARPADNDPPAAPPLNETRPPQPPEVEQAAMNPPKPPPVPRDTTDETGDAGGGPSDAFRQLDVDGDGRISAAEGQSDADFNARFETIDADRDGGVSDREFRAPRQAGQYQRDRRDERDQGTDREGRDQDAIDR